MDDTATKKQEEREIDRKLLEDLRAAMIRSYSNGHLTAADEAKVSWVRAASKCEMLEEAMRLLGFYKRRIHRLQNKARVYRDIFAQSSVGILLCSPNLRVLDCNEPCLQYFSDCRNRPITKQGMLSLKCFIHEIRHPSFQNFGYELIHRSLCRGRSVDVIMVVFPEGLHQGHIARILFVPVKEKHQREDIDYFIPSHFLLMGYTYDTVSRLDPSLPDYVRTMAGGFFDRFDRFCLEFTVL
jgi:hypothetical protein